MARIRVQRLEKELLRLISNTVNYKLRDSRLSLITITAVRLTNDFSLAKIYFTRMDNENHEVTQQALTRSSGFIKREIAAAKLMRAIPELRFLYDEMDEQARKLDSIFDTIHAERGDHADTEDTE